MKFNFTFINDFISFLVFFIFSYFLLFSKIINSINEFIIFNFKKEIFEKYNKTINNLYYQKFNNFEKEIKLCISCYIKKIELIIEKKKNIFFDLIEKEKKIIFNNNKKKICFENINLINNFIIKLKKKFLISFKKIYNNIINYNSEFIISYD